MNTRFKKRPETEPLAKKWSERISSAKRHWDKFHRRVRHNRQLVSGLDWSRDPDETDFYMHRANLIYSTIMGILPSIYARNPEISVMPQHRSRDLKLLCKTIETVTNRYLEDAGIKQRAKATVRAALTCSFGVLKVMYQQGMKNDALIRGRIPDSQDNMMRARGLSLEVEDNEQSSDAESQMEEIKQTVMGLEDKAEIGKAEGLVIDRIMTEHLLIDPSIAEFWDYELADWMIQIVPMKREMAEGLYGYKLDKANVYRHREDRAEPARLFSGEKEPAYDDSQICILEIWDKQSQRVYTMAEGCDFWLKAPFTPPHVGERWYPFFLLPFQTVDGQFIGPSIVDLTERLQDEHNTARDRYNEHRDLIKPGYIASAELNEKTLRRFSDSELGEITLIDSEGQPIQQAIMPKAYPPIDPAIYDTGAVRQDWEMVTGLQDASRSSIVTPKTATEANILQQSLSGRIAEFRDQVEDYLQQIAQYTAEILIQELDCKQVEKIMGQHKTGFLSDMINPGNGFPVEGIVERAYDWPELSRDEVFDLVQLKIRAGTTGMPDNLDRQDSWIRLMPVIQPLISQIMQFQLEGINPVALISLLKESVIRFDDKLDLDTFVPDVEPKARAQAGGSGVDPAVASPDGQEVPQRADTSPLGNRGGQRIPSGLLKMLSDVTGGLSQGMPQKMPSGMSPDSRSEMPLASMPDRPSAESSLPIGNSRSGMLELSPEAIRHLPREILDMLGPDALPDGMTSDSRMSGKTETSLKAQPNAGQALPAGLDKEKAQALLKAIMPIIEEESTENENPGSVLLKKRLKAIRERQKK